MAIERESRQPLICANMPERRPDQWSRMSKRLIRPPSIRKMWLTTLSDSNWPARPRTVCRTAAEQLGIGEITLLVIRPDGHIGLRSDRNHVEDLTAYQQLLVSGQT